MKYKRIQNLGQRKFNMLSKNLVDGFTESHKINIYPLNRGFRKKADSKLK